jgi:hypothetical protein
VVDTPYTQGIAGWVQEEHGRFETLDFSTDSAFAVVVASSVGDQPIADANRLLVTAISRVEPSEIRWVDETRRAVADPGRPPFLQEPVSARVNWRHKGTVKGYVLDNTGKRIGPAKVMPIDGGEGVTLVIDGRTPAFHWELIAE